MKVTEIDSDAHRVPDHDTNPHVAHLVASIVADISPQFEKISRCHEALAQPVSIALAHAWKIIGALRNPLALDLHLWPSDPSVPVLFPSVQECLDVVSRTSCVKKIFATGHAETCFMFLTMRRHEYVTLGSELSGEIITRDVQQHVVEFIEHRIPFAASTLKDLRQTLVASIVLYLGGIAPRRIHDMQAAQTEAMHAEELLKGQIHTLDCARREYRPFSVPRDLLAKLLHGETELAILEQKRVVLAKALDSNDCLAEVRKVLADPHEHIRLEHVEMRVGDFGITSKSGKWMQFQECVYDNGQRSTVLLASVNRKTALRIWPDLGTMKAES